MIRYSVSTAEIRSRVEKLRPKWLADAAERTGYHKILGRFTKKGETLPNGKKAVEFWGRVKEVFIRIQHGKCIYCEIDLERSKISWALEHFRPKDGVTEWKSKTLDVPTGAAMQEGYYLLAYDLENYAASCDTCNTNHKKTVFPIAKDRVVAGETVAAHASEEAYLLFPLGDLADDPEEHIAFIGAAPVARDDSVRGTLSIELLGLDREGLEIERAKHLIHSFWPAYEGATQSRPKSLRTLSYLLSGAAPFANCTRCYYRLCQVDHEQAERLYFEMLRILKIDDEDAL